MEYVQGAALKDLIERGLSPAESVEIVRQILTGVALRARARDRPPRPEAAQRAGRRRGPRPRDRLRHRPRRRVGDHPDRLGPGHGPVPLARAGAGARDDRVLRPLLGRRDPLRGAHRPGPVRGRDRGRDRAQAGLRAARRRRSELNPRSRPRSTRSSSRRSPRIPRTASSRRPSSCGRSTRPRRTHRARRRRHGGLRRRRPAAGARRRRTRAAQEADRAGGPGAR